MKRRTAATLAVLVLAVVGGGLGMVLPARWIPPHHTTISAGDLGALTVAAPWFGVRRQVVAFVDTAAIPPLDLADRIARLGARAVVVDAARMLAAMEGNACLDPGRLPVLLEDIAATAGLDRKEGLIVSGVGPGGLVPLIQAEAEEAVGTVNLSVDFSAELPAAIHPCPPFAVETQGSEPVLTAVPPLRGGWHAVWADHPPPPTARLLQGLSGVEETIAAYDTPADVLLVDELGRLIAPAGRAGVPMAVVEVPARGQGDTVTLFYSGDGGWRDLDRIVAGEMAQSGYPVVGVDTLRTFWSHKTPEQAARELSATLDHYRRAWGAKSFVLAGFSFGADILAPIFNRLAAADRGDVKLLVLLSPSRTADFGIKVSGWLGKDSGEMDLAPELTRLPADRIICIYGIQEQAESGCTDASIPSSRRIELPGGHHFDEDYPKLTQLILSGYKHAGIQADAAGGR